MKPTRWAYVLGLAVLATVAVTAQKQKPKTKPEDQAPRPAPSMSPLFRTTTDAVSVDVVVRTATGQFIPDLKVGEFVVLEDGVPQNVQTLAMSNGGRYMNLLLPTVRSVATDGMILPTNRPPQDVSGRVFVFFVDDANIEFMDTPVLRDKLRLIVRTLFHQGDLVSMVSSGMSSIELNQTYDLTRLDQEISKIQGSGMSPHDLIQSAQTSQGPAGLRYQANAAFRTAMDMVDQLEKISGKRKSLIWVSSGYDFNPFVASRDTYQNQLSGTKVNDPDNPTANSSGSLPGTAGSANTPVNPFLTQGMEFSAADLNVELSLLATAANRANTTFYAIDPRGLTSSMANLTDNFTDVKEWRDYTRNTQDSLKTLSELTGGFAITNTNEFVKGIKRIDGETSDYYILGYTSNNPDPLKTKRKIDVQVTRAGAVVTNWRRAYDLLPLSLIKK